MGREGAYGGRWSRDFLLEVAMGEVPGHALVNKFGRSTTVGTTFAPITLGGVYRTPQPAGAVTLRIAGGGHVDDTAAGDGAREITFEGLDQFGKTLIEAVPTNGALASDATTGTFIRLFRSYVSATGTYATETIPSHAGQIDIEDGGGIQTWATITNTTFGRSQTQIGVYSVALGKTAYLLDILVSTDTSKATKVLLFWREGILKAVPPYDAMRLQTEFQTKTGEYLYPLRGAMKFVGPCDLGFMGAVDVASAEVDVDFELLIVDD